MPTKTKKPPGRPAERFQFPQTFEQIAEKVSNLPKPKSGGTATKKPKRTIVVTPEAFALVITAPKPSPKKRRK